MNLTEHLDSTAVVPFSVDGLTETLYCGVLTLEDLGALLGMNRQANGGVDFTVALLSRAIRNADGTPRLTAEQWRRVPAKLHKLLSAIAKRVQEINGLLSAEEVKELGKDSAATS